MLTFQSACKTRVSQMLNPAQRGRLSSLLWCRPSKSVADRGGAGEQLREHLLFDGRMARASRDGKVQDRSDDVGVRGQTGRLDVTAELLPPICRQANGDWCVACFVSLVRHLQKLGAPFARLPRAVLARASRVPGPRLPRSMGSQGRSEVSLAVEAGAETPVVVQDAKVLTVGHKGRG